MGLHHGGCHCAAVRFVLDCDSPLEELYRCNCSLCRKKGIIMRAVPDRDFTLVDGQEFLSLYQWNKQIAEHYFCRLCGVYTHHRRRRDPTQFSVNIECLDAIEMPEASTIALINGLEHD